MNELVEICKTEAMDLFTKRELITPLLESIQQQATGFYRDATTPDGRKAISSMAYRVAQSKTYIESHGKSLASELKALPKIIDSNRKFAKDFLDDLKEKVRRPLTMWEAEQEHILLHAKILIDHEIALADNIEWGIEKRVEQIRIEKEKLEYEAKVLADAKIKAQIEVEAAINLEKMKAETIRLVAQANAVKMEEKAKRDIEAAKQEAVEAERIAQRVLAAQNEIEKNRKENIDRVDALIIEDFMAIRLNEKQARYLVTAIRDGKIRNITIR